MDKQHSLCIQRTREILVYANRYISIFDDEVRFPNGVTGRYLRARWTAPYSVAVLPMTTDGKVVLIQQFNYAFNDWAIQVPKGMGCDALAPAEVARCELREETGYEADSMQLLRTLYVDPGFIVNPTYIFLATQVRCVMERKLEATELIGKTLLMDPAELHKPVWSSRIVDPVTLVALTHVSGS